MSKVLLNSVKKMSLNYCECPLGDMHAGQMMNLVCVDSQCSKRGLICPVCRMYNHQTHQILPLKIFLDEVKKLFMENQNDDSLNNLSDYLRSLQGSRKQLMNILKEAAQKIANEFKKIQQNIQDNYIAIRRNILAQSSISTKLPNFIETLSKNDSKDAFALQEEFHRYSELIQFENNNMNVSDKSKKLVEDYSKIPNRVSSFLNQQVKLITKSFNDSILGKSINTEGKSVQILKQFPYVFSSQQKTPQIQLKNKDKTVFMKNDLQNIGIAYVVGNGDKSNKKITFKINISASGLIIFGASDPKLDQQIAYFFDQPLINRHFFSACNGYNSYNQSEQEDYDFMFDQSGIEIEVQIKSDSKQLIFTKKSTQQKRSVSLASYDGNINDLRFFVALGEGDQVSIIDL